MHSVTLVVTSCGRHDLLDRTLRSFVRFNTYPIQETVIVEDSDAPAPGFLEEIEGIGPKTWITNGKRKGQIYSIDRAYAEVKTPLIFHVEDDWEFFRAGFIEESMDILQNYPNILQCSIRDDWDHPSVSIPDFPFPINQPDWREGWSGFSFNPHLLRLADYQRIGSYGRHVGYYPRFCGELALSKLYRGMGFFCAALPAACKHIGDGNRHIPWETAPKAPKVLIAIPACHQHNYESHQDSTIHLNNAGSERIDAVRATWQKYLPAFKEYVDMRFFFGQFPAGANAREALNDEVFLTVDDAYDSLPKKVQAIHHWALERNYDFVFKADDDTFIYLDKLLASGFENYDYLGYCTSDERHPVKERYASGGSGYWLSKKAMKILAETPVDDWAEDRWVGNVLFRNGIKAIRDPRYLPGFDKHYVDIPALPEPNSYISFHACSPKMMQQLFERPAHPTFKLLTHAMNEAHYLKTHQGLNFETKERVEQIQETTRLANGLRVLIAITSCHQRKHLREVQRDTWVKEIAGTGAVYRFFLGEPPQRVPHDPRRGQLTEYAHDEITGPAYDEVFLKVPDSYEALPQKTQALLDWAFSRGYDYVFKCDDDTYCNTERLLASGFETCDYSGFSRVSEFFGGELSYGQGGAGYWLSRKAIQVILQQPTMSSAGPEDITVAKILAERGILLNDDTRYQPTQTLPPRPGNFVITAHRCKADDMLRIHQSFDEAEVRLTT